MPCLEPRVYPAKSSSFFFNLKFLHKGIFRSYKFSPRIKKNCCAQSVTQFADTILIYFIVTSSKYIFMKVTLEKQSVGPVQAKVLLLRPQR